MTQALDTDVPGEAAGAVESDVERIFQIRVVSLEAGGKAAIGSGFQASADGLIVTNYHVVSEFISSPELYEIRYVDHAGRTGSLELLDIDVIADLAVLRHPDPSPDHFELATEAPRRGETVHALGNPGDWGMVLVSGAANGLVEHSYEQRVLFSGSLNSGMSGGPSLNTAGEVIGVNVATAGSQLSFLVPVDKLVPILARGRHLPVASYRQEIARQIRAWQRPRIEALLDEPWPNERFIGRTLFGEIRSDFQCWGDSNESDTERTIERVGRWCRTGDDVYLNADSNAGQIRFSFHSLSSVKLNGMQFARAQSLSMSADNLSSFEISTNYLCESNFVDLETDTGYRRVVSCIRAYKRMSGLYDSLLMSFHHEGDSVFKAHLSLSALEKDQIQAMNKRFLERAR